MDELEVTNTSQKISIHRKLFLWGHSQGMSELKGYEGVGLLRKNSSKQGLSQNKALLANSPWTNITIKYFLKVPWMDTIDDH